MGWYVDRESAGLPSFRRRTIRTTFQVEGNCPVSRHRSNSYWGPSPRMSLAKIQTRLGTPLGPRAALFTVFRSEPSNGHGQFFSGDIQFGEPSGQVRQGKWLSLTYYGEERVHRVPQWLVVETFGNREHPWAVFVHHLFI